MTLNQERAKPIRLRAGYLAVALVLACSGSGQTGSGSTTTNTSTGGVTSAGGTRSTGGLTSSGGLLGSLPGSGGSVVSSSGTPADGAQTYGGSQGTGGTTLTGGKVAATGGATSTGGMAAATGGISTTGGKVATAGGPNTTGGKGPTGGVTSTGGVVSSGGSSQTRGVAGAAGSSGLTGPCDIYQTGKTPCVAAHSTVRALYGAYTGKLYQLRRADKATEDISVLTPSGYADSAAQDKFCAGTKCTISIIYDQSPQHNDLTLTSGGWIGTRAKEADAFGIKVTLNGHTVYGIHVPLSTDRVTGVGYRNNAATGTATGDEPESMYMVANGKAYSSECCFDYGNAEANSLNNGNGTMEAIYFGNCTAWGRGEGAGPWVMADLENGLFSGKAAGLNSANKSIASSFFTAMVKGRPHTFAIKAGDAQSGVLSTMYEGAYPTGGYDPMKKEGAIVLGTGGDNSFMGAGDFFEGAMTTGYATDATDNAVHANIVAAGYGR